MYRSSPDCILRMHIRLGTRLVCVCVCVCVCKLIDGIVPRKGPNACFFKISLILEVSSIHCYLRTENRSICHGVVNF